MRRFAVLLALGLILSLGLAGCSSARFELGSLEVTSSTAAIGDTVTVAVDVSNVGKAVGTYPAILSVDGIETEIKEVTVEPGATRNVSFTLVKDVVGDYEVGVGDLKAPLRVHFQLGSLEIDPSLLTTGDTATVRVQLSNAAAIRETYAATLTIDGVLEETKDVTVGGGATQNVTFTVVKQMVGDYLVEVGSSSGTLQVVKPAEFRLGSLEVAPVEVILGDEVTATVEVANVGGLEGNYAFTLLLGGVEVQSEEVTLAGGETTTVSFTFTPEERGSPEVTVGDLAETITVLKPAELRLTSLVVSPRETAVGSSATVTVNAANTGDVQGSFTVTLKIDGTTAGSKEVTLAGGETESIRFAVTGDTIGTHNIKVNALSGNLRVTPTPPAGYLGYSDWSKGFFIAYPTGWDWKIPEGVGNDVAFTGIDGSDTIFVVTVSKIDGFFDALSWVELTAEDFAKSWTGYVALSTEEVTVNDMPGARHEFMVDVTTTLGEEAVSGQVVLVLISEGTAAVFAYGALLEDSDEYGAIFDTMINSFQLLP